MIIANPLQRNATLALLSSCMIIWASAVLAEREGVYCEADGICTTIVDNDDFSCRDHHERCSEWASAGECTINPSYMSHNCARSCGTCGLGQGCTDLNDLCEVWAAAGECAKNPQYMSVNCALSCDTCGPEEIEEDLSRKDDCVDLHDMCKEWSSNGECLLNWKYMETACRASCMLCVKSSIGNQSDDAM